LYYVTGGFFLKFISQVVLSTLNGSTSWLTDLHFLSLPFLDLERRRIRGPRKEGNDTKAVHNQSNVNALCVLEHFIVFGVAATPPSGLY
jgi:hypothetical protein